MKKSGVEKVHHRTVKNCHYCGNYIAINNNFNDHIERCAGTEGIEYSFDNSKIISFQDNFNFTFTVYFYFETTTGDDQTGDSRMYLINYFHMYTFYLSLNFEKLVVLRSFQQSPKELSSLNHITNDQIQFSDRTTYDQLKDTFCNVFDRERPTTMTKLFSVKLKVSIDLLKKWFESRINRNFLELGYI